MSGKEPLLNPSPSWPAARNRFQTTRWSLVQRAAAQQPQPTDSNSTPAPPQSNSDSAAALGELCQSYWYPVYAHIRRRGRTRADAEDLTQEFFSRLLNNQLLESFDPERGRFRTFLLAAVNHFLANEWDRSQARKRGGGQRVVSLNADLAEHQLLREHGHGDDADREFEQRWAREILKRVFETLREEFAKAGKSELFDRLFPYLAREPGLSTYGELAQHLSMSEAAIKVAVHRMRNRYGTLVRSEIAETVNSHEQIDDELHRLFAALSD